MNIMGKPPLGQKIRTPKDAPVKRQPIRHKAPAKPDNGKGPYVSQKLRDFAKGQPCQMRSEFCNGNSETTVFCHSRRRATAGMGQKPHDFWGYHGCSDCHANEEKLEDRELYDAIRRTQYAVYAAFGTITP
jgi:hypothetical protein